MYLFRLLPAFIWLSLSVATALAQTPLSCRADAGVPPVVRAEGTTELIGDLLVTCRDGDPAAGFTAKFFLYLNTNTTSRIFSVNGAEQSEALLLIDEPGAPRTDIADNPSNFVTPYCMSSGPASNASPNTACNPTKAGQTYQQGYNTVFRASGPGLVWDNIPVTPPGPNRSRTFRFTNIRANAAALGASQTLIPSQIVAYLSVLPAASMPIDNPQQTVGYVQTGLLFDVRNCADDGPPGAASNATQCGSVSPDRFDNPSTGSLPSNGSSQDTVFGLRFREGFQTSFKPKLVINKAALCFNGVNSGGASQDCSQPGQVFNAESGFVNPVTGNAGLSDAATRLAVQFRNVPANVRIFVSSRQTAGSTTGTEASLISVASSGVVYSLPTPTVTINCGANSTPGVEVPLVGGAGSAVWEVSASTPAENETLLFSAAYAFRGGGVAQPALGTAQVTGQFAPGYGSDAALSGSMTLPIPRFNGLAGQTPQSLFKIRPCGACQLSFSATSLSPSAEGGGSSFTLTPSSASCQWSIRTDAQWISVFPLSGTGPATIIYRVFSNVGTVRRAASVNAVTQGETFSIPVIQAGSTADERRRFIRLLYFSFIGREPSPAEIEFHAASGRSYTDMATDFYDSAEFSLGGRLVAGIYVGLLERDPEFGGWQFQRFALAGGGNNQVALVGSFLTSPEYALHNGTQSDGAFVTFIFQKILARSPLPAELTYRTGQLQGGMSRGQMAADFLASPEFKNAQRNRLSAFLLYPTLLLRDSQDWERTSLVTSINSGVPVRTLIDQLINTYEFRQILR